MKNRVPRGTNDEFGERRSPWLTVLRYALLILTIAGLLVCFLVVRNAWISIIAVSFSEATGVAARYRASLFEKLFVILLGIGAVAAVIVCDWFYGKAKALLDLLRRFARVAALAGLLLGACHGLIWLLGARTSLLLALAGGELFLGVLLLLLSLKRRRA
jgi:hypothetical protein